MTILCHGLYLFICSTQNMGITHSGMVWVWATSNIAVYVYLFMKRDPIREQKRIATQSPPNWKQCFDLMKNYQAHTNTWTIEEHFDVWNGRNDEQTMDQRRKKYATIVWKIKSIAIAMHDIQPLKIKTERQSNQIYGINWADEADKPLPKSS